VLRSQSSVGMRHRDHAVTGNTLKSMNTGLAEFFFGPGLDQTLTVKRFLDFQRRLQKEILSIEVRVNGFLDIRDIFSVICAFVDHFININVINN